MSSTPVGAGCAWCSTRPSPRSPASTRRRPPRRSARPAIPMAKLPTGDLTEDGPAYEVMYLLDADDDAIPPLREAAGTARRLPRRGRRRGAVERAHPRRRRGRRGRGRHPGRVAAPDRGHPLRRAGRARPREARRASRAQAGRSSLPGPGLVELFTEAGRRGHRGRPGPPAEHRPDPGGDRGDRCARRSSCCPTTPTRSASPRPPPTRRRSAGMHVVVIPTRAQVQGIAALAVHEPGRPLDSDVVQMAAAARGARHGAVTVAAKDAMTTAGPCSDGRRPGRGPRRLRDRRRGPLRGRHRRARAPARRRRGAGDARRRGRGRRPRRRPASTGWARPTRVSTSSSTRAVRSATRCCVAVE